MSEKNDSALIKQPSSAIEKASPGTKRILADMVSDALALVLRSSDDLHPARFWIGDYEWCEPDYRQIMLWAKSLSMNPIDFIHALLDENNRYRCFSNEKLRDYPVWGEERFYSEGRLLDVIWNLSNLPLTKFEWVEDLQVKLLKLLVPLSSSRREEEHLVVDLGTLRLPRLVFLDCSNTLTPRLNLSSLPELQYFYCNYCSLSTLDLSKAPKLRALVCVGNNLSRLNLAPTPDLEILCCFSNLIMKLELPGNPSLKKLECGANQIELLDLTALPELEALKCERNRLSELNLFHIPKLKQLSCFDNVISHLDMSAVPGLEFLDCSGNRISDLDLTYCTNLAVLRCKDNLLSVLDIRSLVNNSIQLEYDSETTRLIKWPDQQIL